MFSYTKESVYICPTCECEFKEDNLELEECSCGRKWCSCECAGMEGFDKNENGELQCDQCRGDYSEKETSALKLLVSYGIHEPIAKDCIASRTEQQLDIVIDFLNRYGKMINNN